MKPANSFKRERTPKTNLPVLGQSYSSGTFKHALGLNHTPREDHYIDFKKQRRKEGVLRPSTSQHSTRNVAQFIKGRSKTASPSLSSSQFGDSHAVTNSMEIYPQDELGADHFGTLLGFSSDLDDVTPSQTAPRHQMNLEASFEISDLKLNTSLESMMEDRDKLWKKMDQYIKNEFEYIHPDNTLDRVRALMGLFEFCEDRLSVYQPVIEIVKEEVGQLIAKTEELTRKLEERDEELASFHTKVAAEIEGTVQRTAKEKADMSNENKELKLVVKKQKDQLHKAKIEVYVKHERLLDALATYNKAEYQIITNQEEKAELTQQLADANEKIDTCQDTATRTAKEMAKLAEDNQDVSLELQSLKKSLEYQEMQTQKSTNELHGQLQAEKAELLREKMAKKTLIKQTMKLQTENQRLNRLMHTKELWTPRPNFEELKEMGGDQVVYHDGTTTNQMMHALIGRLNTLNSRCDAQNIRLQQCLRCMHFLDQADFIDDNAEVMEDITMCTNNPKLPKFMQGQGVINNMKLKRAECESVIGDVWDFRQKLTETKGSVPLDQALQLYLLQKFGSGEECVQYAYSLMDACRRFSWDADCELFLQVLEGNVQSDIFNDQISLIESLRWLFSKLDISNQDLLPKRMIFRALRFFFNGKSTSKNVLLKMALLMDQNDSKIYYEELFASDIDGNQGRFVEELRDQHLNEVVDFTQAVMDMIQQKSHQGKIKPTAFIEGIVNLDPMKPMEEVKYYCHVALGGRLMSKSTDEKAQDWSPLYVARAKVAFTWLMKEYTHIRVLNENPDVAHILAEEDFEKPVPHEVEDALPDGMAQGKDELANSLSLSWEDDVVSYVPQPTCWRDMTRYMPQDDPRDVNSFMESLRRIVLVPTESGSWGASDELIPEVKRRHPEATDEWEDTLLKCEDGILRTDEVMAKLKARIQRQKDDEDKEDEDGDGESNTLKISIPESAFKKGSPNASPKSMKSPKGKSKGSKAKKG